MRGCFANAAPKFEYTHTMAGDLYRMIEAERAQMVADTAQQSVKVSHEGQEAVIDMEVRQLAEESRIATERIRDLLGEIQRATNTVIFIRPHQSLRRKVPGHQEHTPAMAAGLADHVRTVDELLSLPLVYEEVAVSPMMAG